MRRGVTFVELLVVLAIIAAIFALLFPAVQQSRQASRLMRCKNRIRQIAIAAHGCASVRVSPPEPFTEWPIAVLPWLEEQPLADRMADTPRSSWGSLPQPQVFVCPFQPIDAPDQRHYAWITTPGAREFKRGWPYPVFQDTAAISHEATLRPWYEGANLRRDIAAAIPDEGRGPHPSGSVHESAPGQAVRTLPH